MMRLAFDISDLMFYATPEGLREAADQLEQDATIDIEIFDFLGGDGTWERADLYLLRSEDFEEEEEDG